MQGVFLLKRAISAISAIVVSVSLTLGLLLLFALLVKCFSLSSAVIRPVNRVIKAAGVLTGIFISVKEKGIAAGAVLGLTYGLITNVIFGLIGGSLALNASFFMDLLFCLIVGIIGGVLCVNLKNK